MSFGQTFFTKLAAKSQAAASKPQPKMKEYLHIHNLVINTVPYEGRDSLDRRPTKEELSQKLVNPKSSFYLCKKLVDGVPFEKLPMCIIRRVAYRMKNKKDQRGRVIYNDPECKNYDQITTEFQCYRLLKRCMRAVRLVGLLHENTHSPQDKRLFYGMMKLQNRRAQGIKNMMFILEEMNEGSLREQLDRIMAKKQEPFSEHEILEYTCQIVEALKELRLRGIIHRDLRPQNILFHNKQIKISDFDSAFIRGWSDYRHVRNGLLMKDTTPLQIMQLISQPDERLKEMTSQELWEIQQYADVYFLGVNIYSMVFSQPFESFNGGKILANLINIKKRTGFCPKLLDIMARCLQKDIHKRITLDQIILQLGDLQRQTYMKHSTYSRVYLTADPLNLYSFSSNQMQQKLAFEASDYVVFKHMVDPIDMQDDWQNLLRLATVNRNTNEYERILRESVQQKESESIWNGSASLNVLQAQRRKLRALIEQAMQRLQIKAFYYQLVYRMLCEVHTDKLTQADSYFLQNVQSHLELLTNEVVVVVSFIYEMLLKGSFTEDPFYVSGTADYQLRRVYDNSRVLFARRAFFAGRKHGVVNSFNVNELTQKLEQYKRENKDATSQEVAQVEQGVKFVINNIKKIDKLQQLIEDFNDVEYDQYQRNRYWHEYNNLTKFLDRIQKVLKSQMIQTIINLIISYEKTKHMIRSRDNSLKNSIFMLMILQAQNTNHLNKNDIVAIKLELTKFINFRVGWKTEELQAFFANYTKTHFEAVRQGLHELESQAVLGGSPSMLNIEDEEEGAKNELKVENMKYEVVVQQVSEHHSGKEIKKSIPKAVSKMEQSKNEHKVSIEIKEKDKLKEEVSFKREDHEDLIEDEDLPQIKIVDTTVPVKKPESLEMSQAFEFHLVDNNSLIRQSIPVENFEDLDE